MQKMFLAETLPGFRESVEDHGDIGIARRPGVAQQRGAQRLKIRSNRIAKPIERVAQWPAPFLVPSGPARVAAAIGAPALHPVNAAPGSILENPRFPGRRTLGQKLAV